MNQPRLLASGLIGAVVLTAATACAEMPTLPQEPDAAKAVVRTMLVDEAIVLLKASGLKYTLASFDLSTSFDRPSEEQYGDLVIRFFQCTDADVDVMTDTILADSWIRTGSLGEDARKGPLSLRWHNTTDGCFLEMTTMDITQHLPEGNFDPVPELAVFKAHQGDRGWLGVG